jgi:hypothetical protein
MNSDEQNKRLQDISEGAYTTIKELVEALNNANADGDHQAVDDAHDAIYSHPLSVEVRSGWCSTNAQLERSEYRILISWGGPAVQITGQLNDHNEPASAVLQSQDWFLGWRDWVASDESADAVLMTYAQAFYFGE